MQIRALSVAIAAVVLNACVPQPQVESRRDVLWRIVSQCADLSTRDYCSACPAPIQGACAGARVCEQTTQVWAQTAEFVAIRDIKMCGCPVTFVHGLVLPRARVTGVEDPRRPDGIWTFAWAVAKARIPDEPSIALVVDPPGERRQDQLHVHVVRLLPQARARLAARAPAETPQLDQVWEIAARRAAATGLLNYGVLVARDAAAQRFLVVVQPDSPEYEFTVAECR